MQQNIWRGFLLTGVLCLVGFLGTEARGILAQEATGPKLLGTLFVTNNCPGCVTLKTDHEQAYNAVSKTMVANNVDAEKYKVSSFPSLLTSDGRLIGPPDDGDVFSEEFIKELQKLADETLQSQKAILDECVFLAPGNVDNSYKAPAQEGVVFTGGANGYGKYAPFDPSLNSPINKALAQSSKGFGLLETRVSAQLADAEKKLLANTGKKITVYLPNGSQAMQTVSTGKYTVEGVSITAGSKYTPGVKGPDGLTMDANCKPTKGQPLKAPDASKLGDWGQGGNGGGGAGGFGGGGSGGLGGGLGSLLPLLMSGMLGGGQQNGQNQNGYNNGYGAGYGNNQQTGCAQYGTSPVCGTDNRTYTNQCWMQQLGVTMKSYGVCVAVVPTPAPAPTPNVSVLMTQLAASGVPSSLVDMLRSTVASILGSVVGGGSSSEVVIR